MSFERLVSVSYWPVWTFTTLPRALTKIVAGSPSSAASAES
jgi:hypothetical protein